MVMSVCVDSVVVEERVGGAAGSWVRSGKLHATPRNCMQQHVIATQKKQVVIAATSHHFFKNPENTKNLNTTTRYCMQQLVIALQQLVVACNN